MPLILGTNSIKDTGFNVANSLRFNSSSSDHLNRSTSSGDRLKWTWSAWLKKTKNGADEDLFSGYDNSSNFTRIQIGDTGRFNYINKTSGTQNAKIETNRVFRDNSAWYHFVIVWDTGNATAGNRMRIYVNGVEETSFANETQPSLNQVSHVNQASKTNYVGTFDGSGTFFNGYMAEVVLIDGQALDPTSFGEFDEDSPTIWKPKDVSGLTFGTNGFYLDFEDSSSLGNDAVGSNNFTVNNLTAIDQSIDTCTNNFATLNGLDFYHNATANTGSTLTEGSLYYQVASGNKGFARSTFGVSAGKWYFEAEANSVGKGFYGVCNAGIMVDGTTLQNSAVYYYENVPDFRSGDQIITTGVVSVSAGDILGFALDMDNHALYISKNGTYMNSGNPASGSSRTGAISELFTTGRAILRDFGEVFANVSNTSTTGGLDAKVNFGSPPYSESGGNSDGNGYGNFKTAPPSGYYSWNTKNLAEFG